MVLLSVCTWILLTWERDDYIYDVNALYLVVFTIVFGM